MIPVLEGRYQKAVASSPQRESVLRALASKMSADGEVWTTDAYKIALNGNVDNPSQYMGHLVTAEYGVQIRVYDAGWQRDRNARANGRVEGAVKGFTLRGSWAVHLC